MCVVLVEVAALMTTEESDEHDGRHLSRPVQQLALTDKPVDSEDAQPQPELTGSLTPNMVNDPVAVMRAALALLSFTEKQTGDSSHCVNHEERLRALQVLRDSAEMVDHANDLCKLGALPLLESMLVSVSESEDDTADRDELAAGAAGVIADMVQNNPPCQQAVLERPRLLSRLLQLVAASDASHQLRMNSLQAVSGLLRHCLPAQRRFCQLDGCASIIAAVRCVDLPRLQAKAAFLLASVCVSDEESTENSPVQEAALASGLPQQLCMLLQQPHAPWHEHLLAALLSLLDVRRSSTAASAAIEECRRPQLQLLEQLSSRLEQLAVSDESREVVEHCHALKRLLITTDDDCEQEER